MNGKRRVRRADSNQPKGAQQRSVAPPVWEREAYALIDDGRLTVRVVEIQGPEWVRSFQRWCLRLGCEAVHEPASLSLFFNLAGDKSGPGQPGRQSKFFTHWMMANGAPPKKGEAMNWEIFRGKAFVAEVQRVTKNAEGEEKQEGEEYSRIVRFIRRDEIHDASPTHPSMNQESENQKSGITQSSNQVIKQSREPYPEELKVSKGFRISERVLARGEAQDPVRA